MSILSKTIELRIPSDIVYRALKDTRLEKLFPEFFIGIERKFIIDKTNEEIGFNTINKGKYIEIIEIFKFNIIYSLLMLETGYINGVLEKKRKTIFM